MQTILCFGDSNTHGTIAMPDSNSRARFPRAQRWPSVMASLLGDRFEVIQEGHPGRNAAFDDPIEGEHKNGRRMLQALLETHRPVDLLIIMLGTNDLKARFNVSPFEIALAIEKLAVHARQVGVNADGAPPDVLIVSPVPILETGWLADMFAGGGAKSKELARHLEFVADRQSVAFLDLATVAAVDPVDGIHLTAEAQAAIGRSIAFKVQKLLGQELG